jgi:HEAT repeat protein
MTMSSTTERVIAYHIARLRDKNPQVRIESIQELLLLEATEAFDALEELFRNDPDSGVRKAAQHAGRMLYLKINRRQ